MNKNEETENAADYYPFGEEIDGRNFTFASFMIISFMQE